MMNEVIFGICILAISAVMLVLLIHHTLTCKEPWMDI